MLYCVILITVRHPTINEGDWDAAVGVAHYSQDYCSNSLNLWLVCQMAYCIFQSTLYDISKIKL